MEHSSASSHNDGSHEAAPTNDTTGDSSSSGMAIVLEPLIVEPHRSVIRLYRDVLFNVEGAIYEGHGKFRNLFVLKKSQHFDLVSYSLSGHESYTSMAKTYDPETKRYYNEKRVFYVVCHDLLPIQSKERIADEFITALWSKCFGCDFTAPLLSDDDANSTASDDYPLPSGRIQQRFSSISTLLNIMMVLRDLEISNYIDHVDVAISMQERNQIESPSEKLSVKQLIDQFNSWQHRVR
ncbi:hypothetical protein M3Y94_00878500 [Aphelenchoides besseyi]|nr:hypothetical protein M3Y94_00878500 [Aphelenchoides besseyi]KAI6226580.1 hypothetical protein M3Y95_00635900 [Aphelenchoides besseyi]